MTGGVVIALARSLTSRSPAFFVIAGAGRLLRLDALRRLEVLLINTSRLADPPLLRTDAQALSRLRIFSAKSNRPGPIQELLSRHVLTQSDEAVQR